MTTKLEQAARRAFETWWEREGQEFLYALNTTTDDDIKLVAEIAWKNGAYCAEQAEQETEVWYCPDCGTLSETQVKCCPDWIRSRKVPKNFAITCKATFDRNEQAEQEPVQVGFLVDGIVHLDDDYKTGVWPLYAASIRTKDLTDDEIDALVDSACDSQMPMDMFARAVIAADREKNK